VQKALAGIRVLDFSISMAGAWCSRLLADFGADVVMVEPLRGHPLRQLAPFASDGAGIPALYVQANKRSVAIELDQPDGRAVLGDLAAASDVVVESTVPGTLAEWGLEFEALEERRPGVILVSITPHGQDGRRARFPGNDLTAYARSGWAHVNGRADREPIKGSGFTASYTAGIAAYGAVLTALCHREMHGVGQQVDVAEAEALGEIFGRSMLRAQYENAVPGRNAEQRMSATFPGRVKDGYLTFRPAAGRRLRETLEALGLADLTADLPALPGPQDPRQPLPDEMISQILARVAELTKLEVFEALGAIHVSSGPVFAMDELARDEHLRDRGFYVRAGSDSDAPEHPGAPFKMSATPWALERAAPAAGEHTAEVLREFAGYGQQQIASLEQSGIAAGVAS
jgi:crotonobetainyl-CoA:carnitine CoA-transferase CaiB-like acyl-CoA transferase